MSYVGWEHKKLLGDNLKVVWAEFSTLSYVGLLLCMYSMTCTQMAASKVENLSPVFVLLVYVKDPRTILPLF